MCDVSLADLGIYCYKFGSFYSGLHETADVLRREANLPDPRPEANPLSTPSNRKVFAMYFPPLLLFRSSFLHPRVSNKRCLH